MPAEAVSATMTRAFRAYCVGLAKTGTTSMYGIFANFRSDHEYLFEETARVIADYRCGVIDRTQLRDFVRERDARGALEMDSASFHAHYIDILTEDFPDARFIVTMRDCCSWLESLLNMLLLMGTGMPGWMADYAYRAFGSLFSPEITATRETFLEHAPLLAKAALRYWADTNRFLLSAIPPERRLVIRTKEISSRLDDIATFVGVDAARLRSDRAHLYPAPSQSHVLLALDPMRLKDAVESSCGDLMHAYFPEVTVESFLDACARHSTSAS